MLESPDPPSPKSSYGRQASSPTIVMDFKMADEKERQGGEEARHGGGVLRWVWIAGVILVFYVLSTGPAAKLIEKGIVTEQGIGPIYAPLTFLADSSPRVQAFFEWYIGKVWKAKL